MLEKRRFKSDEFYQAIAPLLAAPAIRQEEIGRSAEGRPLRLIIWGGGPTTVLIWSQIHGDEPTGSMIIADVLQAIASADDRIQQLAARITLYIVPLLNPDGAERFVRWNGQGLDANRDARAWVTPEARALRAVFERARPQFAIDLHDQDPRKRVGESERFVAYSVLAPRNSKDSADDEARVRSKQLACVAHEALQAFFSDHLARYPDTYEPRGLEEFMQARGVSVVLLEAGGWRGDHEKQQLRKGGYAAVVAALEAIADAGYASYSAKQYEQIPENGDPVHDLLIRGGSIVRRGVDSFKADLAIDFDAPLDRRGAKVTEVGDLADKRAFEVLDATGLYITHALGKTIEVNASAELELTSSVDEDGKLVYVISDGHVLRDVESVDVS